MGEGDLKIEIDRNPLTRIVVLGIVLFDVDLGHNGRLQLLSLLFPSINNKPRRGSVVINYGGILLQLSEKVVVDSRYYLDKHKTRVVIPPLNLLILIPTNYTRGVRHSLFRDGFVASISFSCSNVGFQFIKGEKFPD